jgi:integrase/recombinase XerD
MSLIASNMCTTERVSPPSGARPKRAMSRRELLRLERSKKKADALLLAFNAYMADRRPRPLRPASRRQYTHWIRRAMAIAADTDKSLLNADVRTVRFIAGKISAHPASQNGLLNALRVFFDFLRSQGLRKDNPTLELGRPPQHRMHPRPLSLDDRMLYLDAAYQLGIYHHAIACLGFYMGLRRGEIRTLRWVDFFQADGRVWCDVIGKGGKVRREPVHREIVYALAAVREDHRDPKWIFPSPVPQKAGEHVSESWVRTRHEEIVERAGIPHCTLHQLRHTYATGLREKGADVAVVQRALGHENPATTMIYMDVLNEEVGLFVDRLDFRRKPKEARRDDEAGPATGSAGSAGEGAQLAAGAVQELEGPRLHDRRRGARATEEVHRRGPSRQTRDRKP